MLWAVLKKELIEYFTGFRFWAGSVALLAIAGGVWWAGGEDYRLRRQAWERQSQGYERKLKRARTYSQAQPTVVRPPEPFSILEPGFDSRLGTEVRIVPFRIPFEATGPSHGNELLTAAPEVGLGALVGLVLGFFSLLLTFDSFARERERGSLRLLEAQGLTPGKILLAKYLAGLLALGLPLAVTVALAAERLHARAGPLTGGHWLRVGCLFLACLGYLSCSTLWGLAFSLRAPSRTAALTRAVQAWLLTILVLPVLAGNSTRDLLQREGERRKLGEKIAALEEERDELIRKSFDWRRGFTGHSPTSIISDSETQEILVRMGSDLYYDHTSRCYARAARITAVYAEEIAGLEERREDSFRVGERLFGAVSTASPRLLLDRLTRALAGTSMADHERFLSASRHHHREVMGHFQRIGAFGSWRWFTDDPPGGARPWPRFLGLSPEGVRDEDAEQIAQRLEDPAVKAVVARHTRAWDADPARRLDLAGLPAYSPPETPGLTGLPGAARDAVTLLLFHLGALGLAWRGIRPGKGA